jgi:hypothetical protein
MAVDLGSIDHMSQVISQVVGPSFLLGAVASFISMLFARISAVAEQLRVMKATSEDNTGTRSDQSDIAVLRARIRRLHGAVLLAITAGIFTTILIIAAFAMALLNIDHVWGSATLFIVSLSFFCASLVLLGQDVLRSVGEYDRL